MIFRTIAHQKDIKNLARLLVICMLAVSAVSCRTDEVVVPAETDDIVDDEGRGTAVRGFYLVNEGNMGSNKCTLDYYDYDTGRYSRNFYAERNPGVVKELGDVGNDIAVYGSKVYVVVNCSHKVEVLDARSGVRLGQVNIDNCRNITFDGPNAYVSSYVGEVRVDPLSPLGEVVRVDTASLAITGRVTVGYQPEEMAVLGGMLYVANSGGYRPPIYDNTVSEIRLSDFTEQRRIVVDVNLHRMLADRYGRLWVSSRGTDEGRPSRLFMLERDSSTGLVEVATVIDKPCSGMAVKGDSLYYYHAARSGSASPTYGIIDLHTLACVSENFITDGTDKSIVMPYGIAVHPETGDILLTDAKNYVSSGTLHCFNSDGRRKWSVRTGDIPASIAFVMR